MPFFLESSIYSTYYYYYNILILTNKREKLKKIGIFSEKMTFFCIFYSAPAFQRAEDGFFDLFRRAAVKNAPVFPVAKNSGMVYNFIRENPAAFRRERKTLRFSPGYGRTAPETGRNRCFPAAEDE